jgi:hypothetical protein
MDKRIFGLIFTGLAFIATALTPSLIFANEQKKQLAETVTINQSDSNKTLESKSNVYEPVDASIALIDSSGLAIGAAVLLSNPSIPPRLIFAVDAGLPGNAFDGTTANLPCPPGLCTGNHAFRISVPASACDGIIMFFTFGQ